MGERQELARLARAAAMHAAGLRLWGVRELPHRSTASGSSKLQGMRRLEREVIACTRCPLFRTRTHHVLGEGSLDAQLVFVGEAPGRDEDLQGRPFIGRAGWLLTKMIEAMGLTRDEVYICNVLKDRPPSNRTPLPEEMEACLPFLERQLALIQPRVICTLGSVAVKALLGPHLAITHIRGQPQVYRGIPLIPTYHPAYLLRNPSAKRVVWQDLKNVMALLSVHS